MATLLKMFRANHHQKVMPCVQYIPRNMHTVFALLCFVVVIHWLIFPYPSGLLHWHCGNLTIAPVPAKQPWWIWINTSCEFIMNDCITTTKQSTTKPCAYFLGYTVDTHDDKSHCIRSITPTKGSMKGHMQKLFGLSDFEKHTLTNRFTVNYRRYVDHIYWQNRCYELF